MSPYSCELLAVLRGVFKSGENLSSGDVGSLFEMIDELIGERVQLACELSDALQPCETCKPCEGCGLTPDERPCDCAPNTPRRD